MKRVNTVLLTLLLGIPGVSGAAAAEYYYEYETNSGTLSFTDDLRRVPEKYRKAAERHLSRPLFEYDRATIIEKGAATASAETIFGDQLLSGERDGFDWSFASRKSAAEKRPYYDLEIEDRVYLGVQGADDEPIVVNRGEYVTRDGISSTRTVVRQGDRDLVYIEESAKFDTDPTEN